MGVKRSSFFSLKSEDFVWKQGKSFLNSLCYLNLKHQSRYAVSLLSHRRYPRAIFWFDKAIRVRRIPWRHKLPLFGRLCRSGKAVDGDDLPDAGIQNKEPLELLHAEGQPRMFQYQPHLRFLRWMYQQILPRQTQVQHQTLENLFRCIQCHACLRTHWWEDTVYAWRLESSALEFWTNFEVSEAAWGSRSRFAMRLAVGWPLERHEWLGIKRARGELYIRRGRRFQLFERSWHRFSL